MDQSEKGSLEKNIQQQPQLLLQTALNYNNQNSQQNPDQPQNRKDQILSLGPLIFSMSTLKSLINKQQIHHLYQAINGMLQTQKNEILQVVPHSLYRTIIEYQGQKFKSHSQPFAVDFTTFEFSESSTIPRIISTILFSNLTELNLSRQNISSIEALVFVQAPKLICLQLYQNKILSLEPLIKANFQNLKVLTFYQNPIHKMDQFYRIYNKKLNKFEFDGSFQNKQLLEDYRFLFKMENMFFKTINVKDPSRVNIRKRSYIKALNQPYTQIILFVKKRPLRS